MKVLLSAYACEPNKGSEPGIGWHWALEIARLGHEVWVLTRANNRANIEMELAKSPPIRNLNFLYYDLPPWARWWKKGNRGVYFYYLFWQWGAYCLARQAHRREKFDRVHHITFGSIRQPSFMGNLGIPFIFGPVGGGETAPWRLRVGYSPRGWILDALRDLLNWIVRIDPFMHGTFRKAQLIFLKTPQSEKIIPKVYRKKAKCQREIGINREEVVEAGMQKTENKDTFRILYVGRFIYWKGMHLGLAAFAHLLSTVPDARLTMVGKGPDDRRWHRSAEGLNILQNIDWVSWVPQTELKPLYRRHDVFLFPSLHDSSGTVILEAMAYGLPIVCLDLGGPRVLVNNDFGRVISTGGKSESQVSFALAEALIQYAGNSILRQKHGAEAKRRVQELTWSSLATHLYADPKEK